MTDAQKALDAFQRLIAKIPLKETKPLSGVFDLDPDGFKDFLTVTVALQNADLVKREREILYRQYAKACPDCGCGNTKWEHIECIVCCNIRLEKEHESLKSKAQGLVKALEVSLVMNRVDDIHSHLKEALQAFSKREG